MDPSGTPQQAHQGAGRFQRWVAGSACLTMLEPQMGITLQGLGRLDCKLIAEDEKLGRITRQDWRTNEGILLLEEVTLSYLWVLGVYELLRTLDERCRENKSLVPHALHHGINGMKLEFERLRIPLAKHQRAKRYPEDGPFAWPAFDPNRGVIWSLGNSTMARRQLSDQFLQLLDRLAAELPSPLSAP